MGARLHIIVSCTARKRQRTPPELCLRTVRAESLQERARLWCTRLATNPSATIVARELYAGDHWVVALALPEEARRRGREAVLWVASAGYGLVASSARLHPYSATFVPGDPDSVTAGEIATPERLQAWWETLAAWGGPERAVPRSVAALAQSDPHASVVVVGSPSYVDAMSADLGEAAHALTDALRLVIVSSYAPAGHRQLAPHLIQTTASAQPQVGGSLGSLHVRVVRELLRRGPDGPLRAEAARAWYRQAFPDASSIDHPSRTRMADEDVRAFVADAIGRDPKASRTVLLTRLRQSGRACEQARFGRVFEEVQVRGDRAR